MSSVGNLPEVGIISSWLADWRQNPDQLKSLTNLLRAGVSSFDLYFLGYNEISWYSGAAGRVAEITDAADIHDFVSSLGLGEIQSIAKKLQELLTTEYSGPSIGPRPKFNSIATFFPYVSLRDDEVTLQDGSNEQKNNASRAVAVEAVQKTMYLARCLGCHCVEIVGGAGVPSGNVIRSMRRRRKTATEKYVAEYSGKRLEALADSILEIFSGTLWDAIDAGDETPYLAVELEPGQSFLLNSLSQYEDLRRIALDRAETPQIKERVARLMTLNVDVAHAFLIGYTPEQLVNIEVSHMHLSDHAGHREQGGSHTSDLIPDTFHRYNHYFPWLKFAIERTRQRNSFSGVVALEMEACNSTETVLNAMTITERWINQCAAEIGGSDNSSYIDNAMCEGAIVTLDLGQSTKAFFGKAGTGSDDIEVETENCKLLESVIGLLCEDIHKRTGAVMSFTGDGFIAFFDKRHFTNDAETALNAFLAAKQCYTTLTGNRYGGARKKLIGRASLEWGLVYIPRSGKLKDQIIGKSVVSAVRVCEWLSHEKEPTLHENVQGKIIAVTDKFKVKLNLGNVSWESGTITARGLADQITVSYCRSDLIKQ